MCTCLIAGRKATVSGHAMLAANDDWDGVPGLLTHVPGAVHAEYENYIVTGGAAIPQVRETCGYVYTSCKYEIGNLDRGWAGGMNDCGVAVAGTGVDAYRPVPWMQEGYLLEPDDIPRLILQRGTGARQAVRMIGDLINRYGLRPSYIEGSAGSSAATFSVADREEGWVLEVYPGRCWVAVRVPDDAVSVRVNAFGTHDADLTDPANTMSSPGLAEYARERGLWDGDERHFDFAAAFGSETSPTEWGPEKDPMNLRRRWRAMYLLDGKEEPEETLRYLARPGKRPGRPDKEDVSGKLDKRDVMRILPDVYEGTPYDLTKVPESGRWHDPFAENMPDYALCRRGTVASIVTEYAEGPAEPAGPAKAAGLAEPLLWVAMGPPRLVPYIPVWVDITKLPDCCDNTENADFLYGQMNAFCRAVQERYDRRISLAEDLKNEFQKKMNAAIADECEGERTGDRTEQTETHIREALRTCRCALSQIDSAV